MSDALAWRPDIHLPDARIRIADVARPLSAHDSWRATLGGHLYLLIGTGTTAQAAHRVTGYVGITATQNSGRPWVSLTHWVHNTASLQLDTLALITLNDEPNPDALRILECEIIRRLNPTIYLLNTVTGAPTPARALGHTARTHASHGRFLATVLRHHALQGRANPLLSPAATLRETAVKVVLAADSALDTADVIERVNILRGGASWTGQSIGATARRDLSQREAGHNASQPRVLTVHVRGRCLYYPAHMPRTTAVTRYLATHRTDTAPVSHR